VKADKGEALDVINQGEGGFLDATSINFASMPAMAIAASTPFRAEPHVGLFAAHPRKVSDRKMLRTSNDFAPHCK
jgi:hypothetical protein